MKKFLSIIAVFACATACIYPYEPDLGDTPEGVLVVDGSIIIGGQSTVRLGTMTSLWPKYITDVDYLDALNSYQPKTYTPLPQMGARVWAEDDAGTVYEGKEEKEIENETMDYGWWYYYYYQPTFTISTENAPSDRKYRLCVEAGDGRRYNSDWLLPLAPPVIESIDFTADDETVTVNVTLEGGADATGYVLLSYEETWRFHVDYGLEYDYDPWTNSVSKRIFPSYENYWCWRSSPLTTAPPADFSKMADSRLSEYPLLRFPRQDSRNHARYSILIHAHTIDKNTYRYLNYLEESLGSGDLFSPNPGELPGNVRCESDPDRMVLGYVTVSMETTKRGWLDSRYQRYSPPNLKNYVYPLSADYGSFYDKGYMPLFPNVLFVGESYGEYGWGAERCYNCIAAGGTQTKPDFWIDE